MRLTKWFEVTAVVSMIVVGVVLASSVDAGQLTKYSFENNGNDTATGGTTTDNLTANGTITYTTGVVGQAVSLSSPTSYLSVADPGANSDLDLAGSTWTMETFIKDGTAPVLWKRLVWKWAPSMQTHWALQNNKFDLYANGTQKINQAGPTLNDNEWHHIALTNDSTDGTAGLKGWIDGVQIYSGAGFTVTDTTSPFWLGHTGSSYQGLVDEFIIHDDAKDADYMMDRAALRMAAGGLLDVLVEPEMGWTAGATWNTGYGGLVTPGFQEGAQQANLDSLGVPTVTSPTFAATLEAGTYTIEFGVGAFSNFNDGSGNPSWATSALTVDFTGLTLGEASSSTTPLPALGGWALWSITWDVAEGDTRIGDPLDFSITSAARGPCFDGVGGLSRNGNGFLVSFTPIPEPASLALFGIGLIGLLACIRRRRRR